MPSIALTIIVSIIFFIGMLIPKIFKNKNKLILFTTAITFMIMLSLILFDLIPEIIEILNPWHNFLNLLLSLIFIAIGIFFLKLLDLFIPEHTHKHHDNEKNHQEHNDHLFHIGFITSLPLILHNLLEGMSIYITALNNYKLGLAMAISVGIHNLPLGMEVAASLEASQNKSLKKIIITSFLLLSGVIGACFLYIFNLDLSGIIEGILLSLTLGMLIYLAIFELFGEVKQNIKTKETGFGLIIGLILIIILFII